MNPLTVLSADEIKSIHESSLAVLREVGVELPHPEVLKILADAGAQVDFDKNVARLPERMVEDALQKCGKKYIVYGRDRTRSARFGYGDFVLVSTAGQYSWVDEDGGTRRDASKEDLTKAIVVNDALENINIVGGMAMPYDVPTAVRDVYTAAELVKGTAKPFHLWVANGTSLPYILEILETAAGGKDEHHRHPMITAFVEPISPLRFPRTGLEILLGCAAEGLPVGFGPMAQSGASAPVTLAGTLVV
ncbi:MAG: trimethylamine methyltransferase family protein, partial [Planctomycetota bacterium]